MNNPDRAAILTAVKKCTTDRDAEMLSYSGPIYAAQVNHFISFALKRARRQNISLLLTTYGGDADAAYRLARFLQSFYQHVRLYIVGPCKSAGTLVTLCADELVFGPFGELGPLDMQVAKKDDLMAMASGLDTFQAVSIIRNYAFDAFQDFMYAIIGDSNGTISTHTAGELATQLVTGLFQPLMEQLDPQRMGEVQRLIDIAKAYGERLNRKNLNDDTLKKLVQDYPSHTFIIDYQEAVSLFKKVEKMSAEEFAVVFALQELGACVLNPSHDIKLFDVATLLPEGEENDDEATGGSTQDTREDDQGKPDAPDLAAGKDGGSGPARKRRRKDAPLASRGGSSNGRDAKV